MSTGGARHRSRTSSRGSRRLTRTSRRSRRWRRWFPLRARSAADPPCTSSARSSPRSPPRSSSLAARWPRRTRCPPLWSSLRRPRGVISGRWLCTDPRVSAAGSRTSRTSTNSPRSPPSSESTAARRSPSSAPRSARVETRGRLAESARSVPSRRRTREVTGSSAERPRRFPGRVPSRREPTTGRRGRRVARCSRRTRRGASSLRPPRRPREPTSSPPRFPSSACGFTRLNLAVSSRRRFPLSTRVPTRVSRLFESTILGTRRPFLSTTRACTRSWSDSPPRRCGASRPLAAASRADRSRTCLAATLTTLTRRRVSLRLARTVSTSSPRPRSASPRTSSAARSSAARPPRSSTGWPQTCLATAGATRASTSCTGAGSPCLRRRLRGRHNPRRGSRRRTRRAGRRRAVRSYASPRRGRSSRSSRASRGESVRWECTRVNGRQRLARLDPSARWRRAKAARLPTWSAWFPPV
mmetsp:Transcript_14765/g.60271  ORF Transcript_14765/g.60271 Transcript_14765/m.60271 type:complete len:470 (+) Transcript_14765:2307-3716(+)